MSADTAKVLKGQNTGRVGGKKGKAASDEYQKVTQLEHILLRPDTYIGSTEPSTSDMLVVDEEVGFNTRSISYVPGLFKIFDEIIVNAADNKQRDATMDALAVTIDPEKNEISVFNTGRGIPIEMHTTEKVYIPELIFGHLLTGSNFNDKEKKVTGGRNGYGAKLCNIFSSKFVIETCDTSRGLSYKQVFRNNMEIKGEPEITKCKKGDTDFTKVTFRPDLSRFGLDALDKDHVALLTRRVWDVAATLKKVKVSLNSKRIPVRKFKDYVDRVMADQGMSTPLVHEKVNDRWEVAFTISENGFQQISFVNSIATTKGGTHVKHVEEQITEHLMKAVKKKNKHAPVKQHQVRQHLYLFINSLVENPSFDSQTKENMTRKAKDFGSTCPLSDAFLKSTANSGITDNILHFAKLKSEAQMSRAVGGTKKSKISGIPKLDDANEAGTRNSHKCTLILTEGDSAKALAVSGLGVVGRDHYGVFPLRGKLLNVRDASHKQIMDNAEIKAICQIMGLKFQTKYESVKQLRYGRLMIMADQDQDGSHIKGLVINFLHHYWPSLLKLPGFLVEFVTPIVKCVKGKQEKSFFTLPQYETWCEEQTNLKGWKIKYYKGLGTSTPAEAKEYFSNMDRHQIPFAFEDEEDFDAIKMAFNKKAVEERKEWLRNLKAGTFLDHAQDAIRYADFINHELILFSMADNVRSIPCIMDGFKPGQRKVLFSCFKRRLTAEIKVAQLAGYVAEHSSYHHGEQSLAGTIVGMAQTFVGSNNINLLLPIGQFGTRLQGGKDAASARYIFTSLSPLARKVFHPADDALLNYLEDDGLSIEPDYYVPILPMVLVNGSDGIGTGWSSTVPNYNPREVVQNLLQLIDGQEMTPMSPWYKGFNGEITLKKKDKYQVRGILERISDTEIEISELPIRSWTQSYKEFLETLAEANKSGQSAISEFTQHHTDTTVRFVITMTPAQMKAAEAKGLHKFFKLDGSLATSNMTLFDSQGRIQKYESAEQIVQEFYDVRVKLYQKRKGYLADQLRERYERLDNKVRFITDVIAGTLVLSNRKQTAIVADLVAKAYKAFPKKHKAKPTVAGIDADDNDEDDLAPGVSDFDYLLSMKLWSLSEEKVRKLESERDQAEAELAELLGKTPQDLWKADLEDLMLSLDDKEAADEAEANQVYKKTTKRGKKKASKRRSGDDEDFELDDDDWQPNVKAARKKATTVKASKPKGKASTASSSVVASVAKAKPAKAAVKKAAPKKPAVVDSFDMSEDSDDGMDLQARLKAKSKTAAKTAPAKRVAKKPVVVEDSDDDFEDALEDMLVDEVEEVDASPVARPARSARGKSKKAIISFTSDEEEEDDDDDFLLDEEVVEVKPVKKAPTKKAPAKKAPAKKAPAKKAPAKKAPVKPASPEPMADSEDDSEDEVVAPRSRRQRGASKVSYAVDDDDDDDVELMDADETFDMEEDEDDDDEFDPEDF
eukprot:m.293934 g.293934  ORF g.293934 m.293934 type:complete len:1458 (-) comp35100_c0_seq1:57-4430(-)